MAARGLDGLLMFKQESMYWLTGYDTFGYCFFQCLVLRADGALVLLTRAGSAPGEHTSIIEDDPDLGRPRGADPAVELRELLAEKGLAGKRARRRVRHPWPDRRERQAAGRALDGFARRSTHRPDARLRLVKSPAELAYVRRAAELPTPRSMRRSRRPGPAPTKARSSPPCTPRSSGAAATTPATRSSSARDATRCSAATSRGARLDARDQLTLEFAGVYRQYHACLMRTLLVGEPSARQRALHAACREALLACEATAHPRLTPMGTVFDAHAEVFDRHGLRAHRLNACGYSLGTTYAPSWMDWPMFFQGNPVEVGPGMCLPAHDPLRQRGGAGDDASGRTCW